jgi:hypothetical protein
MPNKAGKPFLAEALRRRAAARGMTWEDAMRMVLRASMAFVASNLLVFVLICLLNFTAASLTDTSRVIARVNEAMQSGVYSHRAERLNDDFSECALLTMLIIRHEEAIRDAFDTKMVFAEPVHPCDLLAHMTNYSRIDGLILPSPYSYVNYWCS